MPLVFRWNGYRFHFFSNEGDPPEPVHIHVFKDGIDAKFRLHPEVNVAYNKGFDARTLLSWVGSWRNGPTKLKGRGMSTSPEGHEVRATSVRFDEDQMWVALDDGRTLGIPLAWFPRLIHGTPAQRAEVRIGPSGLHWEELDEDISIRGLLAGRGDRTMFGRTRAA